MTAALLVLALLLAFLAGAVASSWLWILLVLQGVKRKTDQ